MAGPRVPTRFPAASRWQALSVPNLHRVQVDPADHAAAGAALADDPAVEYVEPDRIRRVSLAAPNDPKYAEQWNLKAIHAKEAWQWFPGRYITSSLNLTRVRVAVLDTGADCSHPDFSNPGSASTDSRLGGQLNWFSSQAFFTTTVPSPACAWQDDHGHGTMVAGIVAAASNNGIGVASLGLMLELAIHKIASETGSSTDSALAQAIVAAVNTGARVITVSLAGTGLSQTLQEATDYAWTHNVVLVAAVGNGGSASPMYPAAYNHVIGVGAFGLDGSVASFSNRGAPVDVVAPGVTIWSTTPVAGSRFAAASYGVSYGTSMAAPHVAALAGLLAMASPAAPVDEIVRRIERSSDSSQDGWSADFGFGRIDAERAITGATWRTSTTGSVSGQVRDARGFAVPGALLTLNSRSLQVDATGIFRFGGIPAGDYSMSVELAGQASMTVPVTVTAGANTPTHFRTGISYATLRGIVTQSGLAAAGAVVTAWRFGVRQAVAITNSTGQYRLYVPLDVTSSEAYDVRAGGMFSTIASTTVPALAAGAAVDLPPLVTREFGRLEGAVRDGISGGAVSGAQIIVSQAGRSFGAPSDAAGDYRTIPGPASVYLAGAEHPSAGVSTPATISLADEVTGRLDLVLRAGAASVTLTPSTAAFDALGGPGLATIATASSSVTWSGSSSAAWLHFASATSGTGSATLSYSVAPNPDPAPRSATIQINGQTLTVNQAAALTAVIVNPASFSLDERGGTRAAGLTSSGSWVAVSQDPWLTLVPPVTGFGNGTVTFAAEPNLTGLTRTGRIGVNGAVVTVTQSGVVLITEPRSLTLGAKTSGARITVSVGQSLAWVATSNASWIGLENSRGTGSSFVTFIVSTNPGPSTRTGTISFTGGVSFTVTQIGANALRLTPLSASFKAAGGTGSFTVSGPGPWTPFFTQPWIFLEGFTDSVVRYRVSENPGSSARAETISVSDSAFTINQAGATTPGPPSNSGGLHFIAVPLCRLVDTRENLGAFGAPALAAGNARSFPITSGPCGIPVSAVALALNVTVVPKGPLGYLTIFPTGQMQPLVSTLNSVDGRVKANAAIVPAGAGGAISVFATNTTELILDINGYFADASAGSDAALAFYPITPCRAFDTRNPAGSLGGPILSGGVPRSFPLLSATCGIPATAQAYSVNATVVPSGPLGYLTL